MTLNNGENTISARAQTEDGRSAEVPTYVLDVDLTDTELTIDEFNEIGVNPEAEEMRSIASLLKEKRFSSGESTGLLLTSHQTPRLGEIIPPIEGAPTEVDIDDEVDSLLN